MKSPWPDEREHFRLEGSAVAGLLLAAALLVIGFIAGKLT